MAGLHSVGLSACELSGDSLGAGLMQALESLAPSVGFRGLAGPRMRRAGCEMLAPMEACAVMGLAEVALRLPDLWWRRRRLLQQLSAPRPDLFVGVDAPDFNLGLAAGLKRRGVPTVQYVGPSVWAWRRGRVSRVARSVDLVMTLFPFEAACYSDVDVEFVGHPLVDVIPAPQAAGVARAGLGLEAGGPLVALLPGSRAAEVERLFPLFLDVAQRCQRCDAALRFAVPAATPALFDRLRRHLDAVQPAPPVALFAGDARRVIAAADVALAASGTVTLECLLLERPMLVAYRMHPLSSALIKPRLRVPCVSLPNLLAGSRLVPEFLQQDARAETLAPALLALLDDEAARRAQIEGFRGVREMFPTGASRRAAECLMQRWGGY
jgi:lipid-A-disaccharide synthase